MSLDASLADHLLPNAFDLIYSTTTRNLPKAVDNYVGSIIPSSALKLMKWGLLFSVSTHIGAGRLWKANYEPRWK